MLRPIKHFLLKRYLSNKKTTTEVEVAIKETVTKATKDVNKPQLPPVIRPGGKEHEHEPEASDIDTGHMLLDGWKEKHASESEANVKADRYKNGGIQELQKKSVEMFNRKKLKSTIK